MMDENKKNLLYFESPTVRGLYESMENWQEANQKRLLSVSIQKDGDMFCCIALSNPTEVVIYDWAGNNNVNVSPSGCLYVLSGYE